MTLLTSFFFTLENRPFQEVEQVTNFMTGKVVIMLES